MTMRYLFALLLVVALGVAALMPPPTAAATNPATGPALDWLRGQQQPDGGFVGFSGASDPGVTADVAVAFAAAGVEPAMVSSGGKSIVDFLASDVASYGGTTGGAAKLAVAAVASGADPRDFGGVDLIARIKGAMDAGTGLFDPQLFMHAYAILALAAAGQAIPPTARQALIAHQSADGSWAFTGETAPGKGDSNTTAIAVEALAAAGQGSSPAFAAGLGYLAKAATSDGSYVYQVGAENPPVGDANSTAFAIQALLTGGAQPGSDAITRAETSLKSYQSSSSGAFPFRADAPSDNVLSTAQAIPALEGRALPVWPVKTAGRTLAQAEAPAGAGAARLCTYFPETQHNACLGFGAFWSHYGGLEAFGYPVTEEFTWVDPATHQPITMQYFERARFEWHPGSAPERFDVVLGRLGAERVAQP
jgi:hypothetical protein